MAEGIFSGLNVADFTWAAAGPIITKQLADNGATVIKIESERHPDSVRLGGPFLRDRPGINRSGFFADFNSSKLSLAVDMTHARASEVVTPLIEWADIVAESFLPGVMERWGYGYEAVRKMNPRVIMLSSSLYGGDGPWSRHPGYGAQGQALAGLHGLTGWPDRPPAAPKGAYTDSVSPRFGTAALLAALIHREKTGLGQYIELSQIETTTMLLTPQLLEYQISGVEQERRGTEKPESILHGVYPCDGDERWIAIEVENDEQWAGLLRVLRQKTMPQSLIDLAAGDARPMGAELDRAMGQATGHWDAFRLMDALLSAGVPAGVALKGSDLLEDRFLRARRHFWPLTHREMGMLDYNGPAYRFEKTPSCLSKAAPCLGEHTDEMLQDVLGFTDRRIDALRAAGVLR
ncbi:CaiB/BaiF CoA transferase family protein [Ferrovibrio xuzhouensis]|uniref:CaiB/BaiF CoA transferase family protein n=1 Tax=Ferrovibrio xuzhouensis TaxID=1576914 RepID=A0ABV7VFD3_9PROT